MRLDLTPLFSSFYSSGALKGALFGAIGAGVAGFIGHGMGLNIEGSIFTKGINVGKLFMKSAMHGLSRGIISVTQGGTFKSGFASGFSASFFSPGNTMGGDGAGGFGMRTSIAAVVGGTASAIGGGKFSNGAVSGAFVHMFNDEAAKLMKESKYYNSKRLEEQKKYQSYEARMARGEAMYNDMKAYSEPLMVAAGTGIVLVVGGEILISNPMLAEVAIDFVSSYFPTGAPSASWAGYAGGTAGYFYGYENFFESQK